MRSVLITSVVALAALAPCAEAHAQQWRRLETARQMTDSLPMKVDVSFGPGRFKLYPITGNLLYRMQMHYDEAAVDAQHDFSVRDRELTLGVERGDVTWKAVKSADDENPASMDLGLNSAVPMELDVKLAAIDNGQLDLGGFKITELQVDAAAAELSLGFSAPNRLPMERMTIQIGAAGAEVTGLGLANAARIRIKGAAGAVSLDFGARVLRDVEVESELAFGVLQISVPADVGVQLSARQFMGKMELHDMTRKEGVYYSSNWTTSSRKITINSHIVAGSLRLQRITPE